MTDRTLLEFHYVLRIKALDDDPTIDCMKLIKGCEKLAKAYGWKHTCNAIAIVNASENIYTA